MKQANDILEEEKKIEDEALLYITDPKKGKVFTTRKVNSYAKPVLAKLFAYFCSLLSGSINPMSGFLIMMCMSGLAEAQYLGEDGLSKISVWIGIFFAMGPLAFCGKSG